MAEVVWSRNAIERVDAIGDYIATSSEHHAELVVERIFETASLVGQFPRMGRVVPEFGDENIREVFY